MTGTVTDMAEKVKPSRRKYHSPLRADQAEQTRRRVVDAAFELFVERGYARTTLAAVAERAALSTETIYSTFGGKRGLLESVILSAITGEDDPPTPDNEWWASVAELADARDRLRKMVEYSCRILVRTRPVHAVIRGAADTEPFAADLARRLLQDRLTNQTARIREYLHDDLKPGLSVAEAGQRYCALTSPELYQMLTVEFRWSADRHRVWVTGMLEAELLQS